MRIVRNFRHRVTTVYFLRTISNGLNLNRLIAEFTVLRLHVNDMMTKRTGIGSSPSGEGIIKQKCPKWSGE